MRQYGETIKEICKMNNEASNHPIDAIGKLLFFDYNKNKFGLISEVKCAEGVIVEKVYVSEYGLSTNRRLQDGELVTLLLYKGPKGFYATNVMALSEATLKRLSAFQYNIGIKELENAIHNSVGHEYQNLAPEDKELIVKIIQRDNCINSWKLLLKIFMEEQFVENHVETFITPLSDEEKVYFLKASYHTSLLNNILTHWATQDKKTIIKLVEAVRGNEFQTALIPNKFISIVKNLELTFGQAWKIYSVFKIPEFASKVLDCFSFSPDDYASLLKMIVPISSINETIIKKLRNSLIVGIGSISADRLLDIFIELKDYKIIKNKGHLLELLANKTLTCSSLSRLIFQVKNTSQVILFRNAISISMKTISSSEIFGLIDSCGKNKEFAEVVLDEYCSEQDHLEIICKFHQNYSHILAPYFINKYYKQLSKKYPIETFELSLLLKHIDAQKYAYRSIIFKTEDEVIAFARNIPKLNIHDEIKTSNKPLTAFLAFLYAKSDFSLTEDCKQFLQINQGVVQCLSVKLLIFQLYKRKINKSQLIDILNSFQWTEISALFIKAFIQESSHTKEILIDKLNNIFKTHFEILASKSFEQKSFHDNFTISNVLNRCDGRKHYDATPWPKNGPAKRWYVNGDVSINTMGTLDCYCEGRPWKKNQFWDSETNQPITTLYEFYWCKNGYCAARNDVVDFNKPFYKWTFAEIAECLDIKIEKNVFATLAGWVNRMNKIVEHLFCRTCKEVLRPLPFRPSTLGYYAVPLFQCINDKCADKQKIRFTHCLNGGCDSHKKSEPLDSRDCESCKPSDPNHTGLRCNYCGESCPACSGKNNRIAVEESW